MVTEYYKSINSVLRIDFMLLSLRYTKAASALYAIVLDWPSSGQLTLHEPITSKQTDVTLLGFSGTFEWKARPEKGLVVSIPPITIDKLPSKWAWVFKLTSVS